MGVDFIFNLFYIVNNKKKREQEPARSEKMKKSEVETIMRHEAVQYISEIWEYVPNEVLRDMICKMNTDYNWTEPCKDCPLYNGKKPCKQIK